MVLTNKKKSNIIENEETILFSTAKAQMNMCISSFSQEPLLFAWNTKKWIEGIQSLLIFMIVCRGRLAWVFAKSRSSHSEHVLSKHTIKVVFNCKGEQPRLRLVCIFAARARQSLCCSYQSAKKTHGSWCTCKKLKRRKNSGLTLPLAIVAIW